jgi:hypothetical protein
VDNSVAAALGALIGAVVGGFASYLAEKKLGQADHRRRLVLNSVLTLIQEMNRVTVLLRDQLRFLAREGQVSEALELLREQLARVSALQVEKIVIQPIYPVPASKVSEWQNNVNEFANVVFGRLHMAVGKPAQQIALSDVVGDQAWDQEFGLDEAVNLLLASLKQEVGLRR